MRSPRRPKPFARTLVTAKGEPRPRRPLPRWVETAVDRGMERRQAAVLRTLRHLAGRLPSEADGGALVGLLERRYTMRAAAAGAAAGAAAVVPGVGTVAALALSAAETSAFFAATAFFVQARIVLDAGPDADAERTRALMVALLLGEDGSDALRQWGAEAAGDGRSRFGYRRALATRTFRSAALWLPALAPGPGRAAAARGGTVRRLLPYGTGALLGAAGGWSLAHRVAAAAHDLFDPSPAIPAYLRPARDQGAQPR